MANFEYELVEWFVDDDSLLSLFFSLFGDLEGIQDSRLLLSADENNSTEGERERHFITFPRRWTYHRTLGILPPWSFIGRTLGRENSSLPSVDFITRMRGNILASHWIEQLCAVDSTRLKRHKVSLFALKISWLTNISSFVLFSSWRDVFVEKNKAGEGERRDSNKLSLRAVCAGETTQMFINDAIAGCHLHNSSLYWLRQLPFRPKNCLPASSLLELSYRSERFSSGNLWANLIRSTDLLMLQICQQDLKHSDNLIWFYDQSSQLRPW